MICKCQYSKWILNAIWCSLCILNCQVFFFVLLKYSNTCVFLLNFFLCRYCSTWAGYSIIGIGCFYKTTISQAIYVLYSMRRVNVYKNVITLLLLRWMYVLQSFKTVWQLFDVVKSRQIRYSNPKMYINWSHRINRGCIFSFW